MKQVSLLMQEKYWIFPQGKRWLKAKICFTLKQIIVLKVLFTISGTLFLVASSPLVLALLFTPHNWLFSRLVKLFIASETRRRKSRIIDRGKKVRDKSNCEAQGKGRAKGRPRKVTKRSFMDGRWWLVVYLSLMLYTKFGCHHPPPPPTTTTHPEV